MSNIEKIRLMGFREYMEEEFYHLVANWENGTITPAQYGAVSRNHIEYQLSKLEDKLNEIIEFINDLGGTR